MTNETTAPHVKAMVRSKAVLGLLCVSICCVSEAIVSSRLQVVLAENHGVMFCHDCADPAREGSFVPALTSFFSPRGYFICAELVYGVPNRGEKPLLNSHEVHGRVALFDRGKVSFARKVQHAQEAGAVGVVILDNQSCDDSGVRCFEDQFALAVQQTTLETDSQSGEPSSTTTILQRDQYAAWRGVQIPSVLVSAIDGERLKSLMKLEPFELQGEIHYMNDY